MLPLIHAFQKTLLQKSPLGDGLGEGPESDAPDESTALSFRRVSLAGVGDFPWFWNEVGIFNRATFAFINHCLRVDDNDWFSFDNLLTNTYLDLLRSIHYRRTTAQAQGIQAALSRVQMLEEQLLDTFRATEGVITPALRQEAAREMGWAHLTSIGFVLNYQTAWIWSRKKAAGEAPLNRKQLTDSDAILSLVPDLPPALVEDVSQVLAACREFDQQIADAWKPVFLTQLAQNRVLNPETQTGGCSSPLLILKMQVPFGLASRFSLIPDSCKALWAIRRTVSRFR